MNICYLLLLRDKVVHVDTEDLPVHECITCASAMFMYLGTCSALNNLFASCRILEVAVQDRRELNTK